MKINNIDFMPTFGAKHKRKNKNRNRPKVNKDIVKVDPPTVSAQSYRAMYLPTRSIDMLVPTKYSGTLCAMISPSTIKTYLKSGDETDNRLVQRFVSTFIETVRELEEQYVLRPDEVEKIDIDGDEVIKMSFDTSSEEIFEDEIMNQANGQLDAQSAIAAFLAALVQSVGDDGELFNAQPTPEQIDDMLMRSYKLTEGYFKLSKTDTGYDFSRKEDKMRALKLIESLEYEHGNDVLDRILNLSKDDNGALDIGLATDIARFSVHSDCDIEPEHAAELLKYFYEKDPAHKKEILVALMTFDEGNFIYTKKDKDEFIEMFELCFDNEGSFDPPSFEALWELDCDGVEAVELKSGELGLAYFPFLKGAVKYTIFEYFDTYKDPVTGKLKKDAEPGSDYFQRNRENFFPNVIKPAPDEE